MFRVKIAWVIAILLLFVLGMAGAMYWGTQRTDYYLERSHLAHRTHEAYIHVSLAVYQHYKELVDTLIINIESEYTNQQSEQFYPHVLTSMQNLKRAIADERIYVLGTEEEAEEDSKAAQIEELERIVFDSLRALERVNLLLRQGNQTAATEMLKLVLENIIDKKLKPMINKAIADKGEEVKRAKQRVKTLTVNLNWLAILVAICASLFSFVVALLLWRKLKTPIEALVWGVRRVAQGDLQHRININGRDEFTYVAHNFNKMTNNLAIQRTELLKAKANLEQKVEERTQALHEVNQRLQRIDQVRRKFFADVSHELRTPLTVIRGEAEVTLRGNNKEIAEYRGSLQRIVDHSSQMAKLVDDLLVIVRSESENIVFDLRLFELDKIITNAAEDAKALGQAKQLKVAVFVPEKAVWVRGNPMRLKQTLLIFIDNACRYSKSGGSIDISLTSDDDSAVIAVSDHGIGIPPEELKSIFERFYRGDQARKLVPSGSGLGLPLAKSIIKAHHGNITIKSKLGAGTTISLAIPLSNSGELV